MENQLKEFYDKFHLNTRTIYKSKYWTLSLRPIQSTLGSCVISLNRYCEKLSDINEDESKDYINIVKFTEDSLSKVFEYDKINYFMLMMVDSHLHYHVIPRYKDKKEFLNKVWNDNNYPTLVDLVGDEVKEETAKEIITAILK